MLFALVGCVGVPGTGVISDTDPADTDVATDTDVTPPTQDTGDTDPPPVLDFLSARVAVPDNPKIDVSAGTLRGIGTRFALQGGDRDHVFDLTDLQGQPLPEPEPHVIDTGLPSDWSFGPVFEFVTQPDGTFFVSNSNGLVHYDTDLVGTVVRASYGRIVSRLAGGVYRYRPNGEVTAVDAQGNEAEVYTGQAAIAAILDTPIGLMMATGVEDNPYETYLERHQNGSMVWRNHVSTAPGEPRAWSLAPVHGGTLICGSSDLDERGRWMHIVDDTGVNIWAVNLTDGVDGQCERVVATPDGGWVMAGQYGTSRYIAAYGPDRTLRWEQRIDPPSGELMEITGFELLGQRIYVAGADWTDDGFLVALDVATGAYLAL